MRRLLLYVFPSLLVFACGHSPLQGTDAEDGRLPPVNVVLSAANREILDKNLYANTFVSAKMALGDSVYRIELRYHGNAARRFYKKTYKVRILDGRRYRRTREYVLSSQLYDRSLLRYHMASILFEKAGLMTVRWAPVALSFNGENGGVYYMVECVDEEFFGNRGKGIGSLYKAKSGAVLHREAGYLLSHGFDKKLPDNDELSYSDLEYLCSLMDIDDDTRFAAALERVFDVPAYLDYLAVAVAIHHGDGINHNYYLYLDPDAGRFVIIPWDFDRTFRNVWIDDVDDMPRFKDRNLFVERVLGIPAYKKRYIERMRELFDGDELLAELERQYVLIRSDYAEDPYRAMQGWDPESEKETVAGYIRSVAALLDTSVSDLD